MINVLNDSQLIIGNDTVQVSDVYQYKVFTKNQKKWGGLLLGLGGTTMIYSGVALGRSTDWDGLNYFPVLGVGVVCTWIGVNISTQRTVFKSKKWKAIPIKK